MNWRTLWSGLGRAKFAAVDHNARMHDEPDHVLLALIDVVVVVLSRCRRQITPFDSLNDSSS